MTGTVMGTRFEYCTTWRPIAFTDDMVRATLEGRKTVTRRVVGKGNKCPYGSPGDHLYVRQAWSVGAHFDSIAPSKILGANPIEDPPPIWYRAADECSWPEGLPNMKGVPDDILERGKWRPPMFMCKWMANTLLRVVDVRRERVQDITEEDAHREGVTTIGLDTANHMHGFAQLWDSINSKRGYSWASNPEVWRVEFAKDVDYMSVIDFAGIITDEMGLC